MATVKRKAEPVRFEVLVSFDGLEKGDTFTQEPDDLGWALTHADTGYLRVVEEAPDDGAVSKG